MPLIGIIVFLLLAFLCSAHRKHIRWRTVGAALLLQISIGALVFGWDRGQMALEWCSSRAEDVLGAGRTGIEFVFGNLGANDSQIGFVFAFRVLPMIVFFSALIAVLYYVGFMKWVIVILGGGLQKLLGTSRAESLSAAANIFVGQTEAPLVVKPYIARMTKSELFAVMCGGLASVAGSAIAGYAAMGMEMRYLLAASFMAAPGGLLYAKIMQPECEKPAEEFRGFAEEEDAPSNILDAAALGAATGMKLALNVGAMLVAFIGLIALVNLGIGGLGQVFQQNGWSLEAGLGWMFSPVAWLTGMPVQDMQFGGSLIGQKLVLNEFYAYIDLVAVKDQISPKTLAISTVALCGFANFSSIAILIGGLGGMAEKRRSEIAQLGMRAVMAGTLSNLTSAAIVGMFLGN